VAGSSFCLRFGSAYFGFVEKFGYGCSYGLAEGFEFSLKN